MLVLIGAVFYAISNIGQERMVKSFDRIEYLMMIGIWGSIISGVQMAIFEREVLSQVEWSEPRVVLYIIGFDACLLCLYTFTPLLLQYSSAVMMNLSFLTADFWSVLMAVALFGARLNALYFAAFATIVIGLTMYNLAMYPSWLLWCKKLGFSRSNHSDSTTIDSSSDEPNDFIDHHHDHDHDQSDYTIAYQQQ
jgi:solute carrier family 35, member F1/2